MKNKKKYNGVRTYYHSSNTSYLVPVTKKIYFFQRNIYSLENERIFQFQLASFLRQHGIIDLSRWLITPLPSI